MARGRGAKLNAACIALAISVVVICGGFVSIGEFFNWLGMSKARSALLSVCADSDDCCDFGDTGGSGDGGFVLGSSAAAIVLPTLWGTVILGRWRSGDAGSLALRMRGTTRCLSFVVRGRTSLDRRFRCYG